MSSIIDHDYPISKPLESIIENNYVVRWKLYNMTTERLMSIFNGLKDNHPNFLKKRSSHMLLWISYFINSIEPMKLLLKYGANINYKDKETNITALHLCCMKNYFESARYLIINGADVNSKDEYEQTALHKCKDGKLTKLLIDNGADVNSKDKCGNPAFLNYLLYMYENRLESFLSSGKCDLTIKDCKDKDIYSKINKPYNKKVKDILKKYGKNKLIIKNLNNEQYDLFKKLSEILKLEIE